MLRSQRNDLFKWIAATGQPPTNFRFVEADDQASDRIEYVGPNREADTFFLEVRVDASAWIARWKPGYDAIFGSKQVRSWNELGSLIGVWIEYVVRETEQPDLWAQAEELRDIVRVDEGPPDERADLPLVGEERDQLIAALNQVRGLLESRADLPDDQQAAMQASLNRLEESSKTLGRKDIVTMTLGIVAGPLFTGVLTMANAQWLLIQIVHALHAVRLLAAPVFQALTG